jgi:hypothetical protein
VTRDLSLCCNPMQGLQRLHCSLGPECWVTACHLLFLTRHCSYGTKCLVPIPALHFLTLPPRLSFG